MLLPLGRVAEWQTRWLQVPVRATSWGFKSPLAHPVRPNQRGCRRAEGLCSLEQPLSPTPERPRIGIVSVALSMSNASGVEARRRPLGQFVVLLVSRVAERGDEVAVAPRAAAVVGWAACFPARQTGYVTWLLWGSIASTTTSRHRSRSPTSSSTSQPASRHRAAPCARRPSCGTQRSRGRGSRRTRRPRARPTASRSPGAVASAVRRRPDRGDATRLAQANANPFPVKL